ncbi:hypothetical protein J4H92_04695 [Leucobacter weissii]|uniref:Uncharacterized protein n=1 Tax=Leucobacter weissii TaxID=1983706 RepID=A0A939MHX8_9MICO|nr:DUF5979 domain-containing protein [Leucobacter weissii]MBO1901244.1 hypothetical protein [Leucobacter weissii]
MPRPYSLARPRGGKSLLARLLSSVALIGLALTTVVIAPSAAVAAPEDIDVAITEIENGSGPGGQIVVGDKVAVHGTWDASTADPHAGDTFTIGLPPEFAFELPGAPFELRGPNGDGDTVTWGVCEATSAQLWTCTLTAEVEAWDGVNGTFEFEVEAVQSTTEDQVNFNLNGEDVPVDLPGEGGIDPGEQPSDSVDKDGAMNADNWSMTWTVDLPGSRMQGQGTVAFTDTLGQGHVLCDPSGFKVEVVKGSSVTDVTGIGQLVGDPGDTQFDVVLTAPEGGFDPSATYRVSYQTCTPDQEIDAPNTTYENSAVVEGWDQGGTGVGEVTNRPWQQGVSKSGSVLGGADRNGKVRWTVTVAGDNLETKNGFTLTESFSGEHELCTDTISGIQIWEQYGPNPGSAPGLRTNITSQLTPNVVSQSSSGFEVGFTINSALQFKPSDWRYIITYDTCVTTDGLPEGGTPFTNEAGIDGTIAGHTAETPGRTDRKTGAINTSAVTIDGVDHLPRTTIDWTITVPGENLTAVGGDLTVTDTLSGAHQVCAVGDTGDAKQRLRLQVQARDQIQGGGLSTVDLTGSATATIDPADTGFTVTIPQPALPQPGGGTATGFSHEYQYVITYTTCNLSGGLDDRGTTYGNSADVAGKTYGQTVTQDYRGSGTGTGVARGSVAISKSLADTPGADLVPAGTEFTVHVKEFAPGATDPTIEYDLQVPLDGSPVSGLNNRGNGWTIEITEPTFPDIPGVVFGDPVFSESAGVTVSDGGKKATAALTPAANISVSLTNTAQLGSLEIVKVVEGPAAAEVLADHGDREYAVTAEIEVPAGVPAEADRDFDLKAGEPYELADLPIGSTVTFSEVRPATDDLFTWGDPVISPESIVVTAGHVADPATITVTNTVERTVGTFSLVKTVTGAESANPAVPSTVEVTATWTEEGGTPQSKPLTLQTDGTPLPFGEDLLIGTEVTLTETPLADGSGIAWSAPIWSGTGVSISGDSAVVTVGRTVDAQVTLENHAATSTAGISLLKALAGEAAGEVDPTTEFPVTASWTDGDGAPQSKDLTINAVEPTPLGEDLPAGTVVTITEGERPGFDTVIWGSIVISGTDVTDNGDGSAEIVVSDQQGDVTLVTVTNEATWAPGTFSLAKTVTGIASDHPDFPETVTVVASWVDETGPQSAEIALPTDGSVVPFGRDLPHLTEVTLSEVEPEAGPAFIWDAPEWSGSDALEVRPDGSAVLTIGAATVAELGLSNNATALTGSLSLIKELSGDAAEDVPGTTAFPVTLSWTDLLGETQERTVEVTADEPVVLEDLPLGTEVTVSEADGDLPSGVVWTGVEWSSDSSGAAVSADGDGAVLTVTGDQGTSAELTATNSFELDATGGEGDEGDEIAVTGAGFGPLQAALIGIVAAALVAAGAVLLIRSRRRSDAAAAHHEE